ncbi:MAG: hypothetical protein AAFV88_15005, partial [Planctomycetota bacterium]
MSVVGCSGNRTRPAFLFVIRCILCVAFSSCTTLAFAQEDNADTEVTQPSPIDTLVGSDELAIRMPVKSHMGRALQAIAVYQSQLVDLVPKNFRPIEVDELREALSQGLRFSNPPSRARLQRGFYDVRLDGDFLVSDQSELTIEHDGPSAVRKSLGEVNLAIESSRSTDPSLARSADGSPLFEVDHLGNLFAVIPTTLDAKPERSIEESGERTEQESLSSSKLRFRWTLGGELVGEARRFLLRVPRTAETRFVFSVPSDVEMESSQGVLVERPGPPPDADVQSRGEGIRWYVLEAGGLDRVELFVRREVASQGGRTIVVRREIRDYVIDPTNLVWKHRFFLDLSNPELASLKIRYGEGTVTGVSVNSVESEFRLLTDDERGKRLELTLPSRSATVNGSGDEASGGLVSITLEGVTRWDLQRGNCDLPTIRLDSPSVIYSEPSTKVFVAVMEPLGVAQWILPLDWRQTIESPSREGEVLLIAEGPPQQGDSTLSPWSQIKLYESAVRRSDDIWTSMRVQSSPSLRLRAVTRVRSQFLRIPAPPLRFEVNDEWTVDSVTVLSSGRQISIPLNGELMVWPTRAEFAQSPLELEVISHRNLSGGSRRISIPKTWILRDRKRGASQLFAIHPPKLRQWDGDSVLLQGVTALTKIPQAAKEFLAPNDDSLVLKSIHGEIPEVSLRSVDVSFSVKIGHQLRKRSDQVEEILEIVPQTSQPLNELTVLTGSQNKTAFEWLLQRIDDSATFNIPRSSVASDSDDPLGAVTIRVDDRDLSDFKLIGSRRLDAPTRFVVSLPSVRFARNQSATSVLDSQLEILGLPAGVQLVPSSQQSKPSALEDAFQVLRYDPLQRPELRLRQSLQNPSRCLVWKEFVEVVASCRSEDRLTFVADVSSRKPIEIVFDAELEVLSAHRNGVLVTPDRLFAGKMTFSPEKRLDRFSIKMRRRHSSGAWIRKMRLPDVHVKGETVERSVIVQTSPESLTLWQRPLKSGDLKGEVWLMPRHIGVAVGFLCSLLVFLLSWQIARSHPNGLNGLLAVFALLLGISLVWWSWQVVVCVWLILPLVLGALTHVVTNRVSQNSRDTKVTRPENSDEPRQARDSGERSLEFSVTTSLLAIILAGLSWTPLSAQSTSSSLPQGESRFNNDPIEVLVPISEDHQRVGNKVYLSESDFQSILAAAAPDRASDVNFRSATYRVSCRLSRESVGEIVAEVYGEYRIAFDYEVTRLNLPFRAETIRRVELLLDDESQIVRSSVDANGVVTAVIPPTRDARLRVTFRPEVRRLGDAIPSGELEQMASEADPGLPQDETEDASEIRLPIPPVHSARVLVESTPQLQITSLGQPKGRTVIQRDIGRYEADLGTLQELVIRCEPVKPNETAAKETFARTYRIAAGVTNTIVECEVTPEKEVKVGETKQFTILGPSPNSLTSSGWRMEIADQGEGAERVANATGPLVGGVYRFTKVAAGNQPIRLLWSIPSVLNDPTSTDDSLPIQVPEVFASTADRVGTTLFAIESSSMVVVRERAENIMAIAESEFLRRWSGYAGDAERLRSFVVQDGFPTFVLLQNKFPPAVFQTEQQLHLTRTHQRLSLKSTISDPGESIRRLMISLPDGFQLAEYRLNGVTATVSNWLESSEDQRSRTLAIGDQRREGKVELELLAFASAEEKARFPIPSFELFPSGESRCKYRITRGKGVNVQLQHSLRPQDLLNEPLDSESLLSGEIPVFFADKPFEGRIQWQAKPGGDGFVSDQISALRYSEGAWFCDVSIRFLRQRIPEYIDIQIPTRWTKELSIDGERVFGQRESADQATMIVRVATPQRTTGRTVDEEVTLKLTLGLDSRDLARIAFPDVQVLGKGRRNVTLAVPDRTAQEDLRWQPRSVRRIKPPSDWVTRFDSGRYAENEYALFSTDGPAWSIELEPLTRTKLEPTALTSDARVFVGPEKIVLHQRFDIIPETNRFISVRMPAEARCLAAWIEGREMEPTSHLTSAQDSPPVYRFPLAYSRLPQALEVLVELPRESLQTPSQTMEQGWLCELVGVETKETWVAFYESPRASSHKRLQFST